MRRRAALSADLINVTLGLAPASPAIAAAWLIGLGATSVLIGFGLRSQWRGHGVRPWLAALITLLLLVGFATASALDGWFGEISTIYSDVYGQPAAAAPSGVTGSWSSVLIAARSTVAVAAVTVIATLWIARARGPRSAWRTRPNRSGH